MKLLTLCLKNLKTSMCFTIIRHLTKMFIILTPKSLCTTSASHAIFLKGTVGKVIFLKSLLRVTSNNTIKVLLNLKKSGV